jgi:hypothetical protein
MKHGVKFTALVVTQTLHFVNSLLLIASAGLLFELLSLKQRHNKLTESIDICCGEMCLSFPS